MRTVNQEFADGASWNTASRGLFATQAKTLQPAQRLWRFASRRAPDRTYTGPWWIGFTPFDALRRAAAAQGRELPDVAREALAVDWDWNDMDIVASAVVAAPLSAWMGTPRTQHTKPEILRPATGSTGSTGRFGTHYNTRWEPDRSITQYYIPGLGEPVCEEHVDAAIPEQRLLSSKDLLMRGWRRAASGEVARGLARPVWKIALAQCRAEPTRSLWLPHRR